MEVSASRRTVLGLWLPAVLTLGPATFLPAEEAAAEKTEKEADLKGPLRELQIGLRSRDTDKVDQAVGQLAQAGGRKGMKTVLSAMEKLPGGEDGLHWSLVSGAISFVDRPALEELGSFIKEHRSKPVARDLLYGLAKNGSIHAVHAARPVLFDAPAEIRLLAATKISRIRSHEAVAALIELMKDEEKQKTEKPSDLMWMAVEGLTKITGQNFGPNSVNWEGWYGKHKDQPLTGPQEGGASGTAVDFLKLSPDKPRREAFVGVEKAPLKSVVVLTAKYEKPRKWDYNNAKGGTLEHTLESLQIPHTVVSREDFPKYDLAGCGALLINCAQYLQHCVCEKCVPSGERNNRLVKCSNCNVHKQFEARLSGADLKKITDFVQRGGYLVCEDWTIKEIIEKTFPKYIGTPKSKLRTGGATSSEGPKDFALDRDGKVDVMPARGMGTHPYLRGIFEPKFIEAGGDLAAAAAAAEEGKTVVVKSKAESPDGPEPEAKPLSVKHTWQIDDESWPIRILDKDKVVTLLISGKLRHVTGGDDAVAVAFRPNSQHRPGEKAPRTGPGAVLAVLSHFGKQGSQEDELAIQNLLLNFLIDANTAREGRLPAAARAAEKKEAEKKAEGEAEETAKP
jgi:hypothetical protein